jgi:hypothetical protein|tara:strand:+ start:375 stop:809 length:435 start_codon:yes stop_codon:yes gene_type:complete
MSTLQSISQDGSTLNSLGRSVPVVSELIRLAAEGKVAVLDGRVVLTSKGQRLQKKIRKEALRQQHKAIVFRALQNVTKNAEGLSLTKPIHFRAAVEAAKVGVESITRTDVLDSLRDLRDEGQVQSVRTSRNNFGVRWKIHAEVS